MTMTNPQTSLLGDKPVHRIGFGAMQLAGPGVFGPPRDPDAARAVLRRAVELGVDHIDTAQFYGPDVVNELIREALYPYPEGLRLVTKVGARRDDSGGWVEAQSPAQLRADVEANLRSLNVERMDLVNLRIHGGEGPSATGMPTPEQLGELADLRQEGKLDLIGVSTVPLEGVKLARELLGTVGEVQNAYSLVHREDEAVVDYCDAEGIAYVPYFPLGSAFSGGPKALAADPAIAGVADKHGVTPSQVALAWLLHRSERILLIPGTSSVAHLEENLAVADVQLDAEDLETLRAARDIGHPQAAAGH
jgi:aryl-alcohol dehydrogenase-like predicted oxidoreductase